MTCEWDNTELAYMRSLLCPLQIRHLSHLGISAQEQTMTDRYRVFAARVMRAYNDTVDELTFAAVWERIVNAWPALVAYDPPLTFTTCPLPDSPPALVEVRSPCRRCTRPGCNGILLPVKWHKTFFDTLSKGFVNGHTVFSACSNSECDTVHGGCWRWAGVPFGDLHRQDNQCFPANNHQPMTSVTEASFHPMKWYFAVSNFVVEVALLKMLLGLMMRGGLSMSAFHEVYVSSGQILVPQTYSGESGRPHFVSRMYVTLISWASTRFILKASPEVFQSIEWYVRPRHQGDDLACLVDLVKHAFMVLSSQHKCMLREKTFLLVVDGK